MAARLGTATREAGIAAFGAGTVIGTLGGLIGLGGAEFRLPLLIGAFRFRALEAVILNKAMSLVVVASALPFRATAVPFDAVVAHWPVILNLLAGSLLGAWFGAGWATRLRSGTLHRVIAILLVGIAAVLLLGHADGGGAPPLGGALLVVAGGVAGFAIGVVASLLGVAGGELLIPTLVMLFGADIKLAGSLSLAVSLPTMVVGFARYSRDRSFAVLSRDRAFVLVMAAGSIVGTFIGGQMLGLVPSFVLLPLLAAVLLVSAVKVWRHRPLGQKSLRSSQLTTEPVNGDSRPFLPTEPRYRDSSSAKPHGGQATWQEDLIRTSSMTTTRNGPLPISRAPGRSASCSPSRPKS